MEKANKKTVDTIYVDLKTASKRLDTTGYKEDKMYQAFELKKQGRIKFVRVEESEDE